MLVPGRDGTTLMQLLTTAEIGVFLIITVLMHVKLEHAISKSFIVLNAYQRHLDSPGYLFFSQCPKNAYLAKNPHKYKADEIFPMLTNGYRVSFDQMG